jgi:hypothetical protein
MGKGDEFDEALADFAIGGGPKRPYRSVHRKLIQGSAYADREPPLLLLLTIPDEVERVVD